MVVDIVASKFKKGDLVVRRDTRGPFAEVLEVRYSTSVTKLKLYWGHQDHADRVTEEVATGFFHVEYLPPQEPIRRPPLSLVVTPPCDNGDNEIQ